MTLRYSDLVRFFRFLWMQLPTHWPNTSVIKVTCPSFSIQLKYSLRKEILSASKWDNEASVHTSERGFFDLGWNAFTCGCVTTNDDIGYWLLVMKISVAYLICAPDLDFTNIVTVCKSKGVSIRPLFMIAKKQNKQRQHWTLPRHCFILINKVSKPF